MIVVRVDDHIKENLDTLVETGLSANRRDAAKSMIEEGIVAKQSDFERIEKTKEEIAKLRKQMQSLVPGQG
jgi:t-SNARE complex subunit (syntaxin)